MNEHVTFADATETPAVRFKRIARRRGMNAVKSIDLIGQLAQPGYQFDEAQIDRIAAQLRAAVDRAEQRLRIELDRRAGKRSRFEP